MERRVRMIQHNGRIILYGDYSGLKLEDFLKGIEELEILSLRIKKKELLHLLNFTDCVMTSEARDRADKMVKALTRKGYTLRTASFGVKGLKRAIANFVRRGMYFARSEAEAKKWLVQNTLSPGSLRPVPGTIRSETACY